MPLTVEITGPDGAHVESRPITSATIVGRQVDEVDVVLADPAVSRRHLRIEPAEGGLMVADLGSSHGTRLDGAPLSSPSLAPIGSRIELGASVLVVGQTPAASAPPPPATLPPARVRPERTGPLPSPPPAAPRIGPPPSAAAPEDLAAPTAAGPPSGSEAPGRETVVLGAAPRPVTDGWRSTSRDRITVRHQPGATTEAAAPAVLDTARRARRALAGFGSEPTLDVVINLLPGAPGAPDTEVGSAIDPSSGEAWLVVTPGEPPEDPHRLLARLFGATLPCADRVAHLVDGYGLHLAGAPELDPDATSRLDVPLEGAPPELAPALATSFVRHLLSREDEDTFRRLLSAPADRYDATWTELYGRSATAMEQGWREASAREGTGRSTKDLLRLSLRYLRPYRRRQAEVFVYLLLSLAFTTVYPFATRALFDSALPSGEIREVLVLLGLLAAAFAVSLLAGLRESYQSAWISGSVVMDLRREVFGRVQRLSDPWLARHSQGDVLSRLITDVARVQEGLSTAISDGLFQVISLVVATVIMFTISPPLALLVALGAPLVAIVYRRMSEGAQSRSLEVSQDQGGVIEVAAENYQALPVIKAFRLGGREADRFERASRRLFRSQVRLSLFGGLFSLSVNGIVTAIRLGAIGLGAWLIFEGRFTIGGLVAFLGIMGEVLSPVTGLTTLGAQLQASLGSLTRLEELLEAPVEGDDDDRPRLAPLQRELRLEGVALSYSAERRALDGVDLTVAAGTRVAFVGPSGAGKSTVLRLLLRLYEPDEGRILLDGVDVAGTSLDSLRGQVGIVFQDSFLFDATIRENIALGAIGATEEQVLAAARAAEVDTFVAELPRGYDTLVGEGGRHLSGGQRQRVAIARALVGDPAILMLDEATSALDPGTEAQIARTLARASEGRTTLAVTHRLSTVVDYDQIVVIDAGRVVETGTHGDLLTRGGTYARLWAEQTGEAPEDPPPPTPEQVIPERATLIGRTVLAPARPAEDPAP